MSKSLKFAKSNPEFFKKPGFFENAETNYDCRTFTAKGLDGKTLTNNKTMSPYETGIYRKRMIDINKSDAIPGQSGFIMGFDSHWAIHFGYDQQGNEYVITKNGPFEAPQIMKYNDLPYWSFGLKSYFNLGK